MGKQLRRWQIEAIACFKVVAGSLLAISFLCSCFSIALGQTYEATPSHVSPPSLNAPSVTIRNGQITAKVYRSDNREGDFYRSTRFDQTGIVGELTLGREKIYGGAWFDFTRDITDKDRALSSAMSDMLIAFAGTGNPSTSKVKLAAWAPDREERVVLDDQIKVEKLPVKAMDWLAANPVKGQGPACNVGSN